MKSYGRKTPRKRGFSLIEVMVVTAISLMLVGVGAFMYSNCLRIYKDSQGLTLVYETAKLINRDMNDYLGCAIPVRGKWISPITKLMPGQVDGLSTSANKVLWYWAALRNKYQQNTLTVQDGTKPDANFSGPSDAGIGYIDWAHLGPNRTGSVDNWGNQPWQLWTYNASTGSSRGWWLPAFFGKRNGASAAVLQNYNVLAGSWGYPQADYRLNADADKLSAGSATLTNGANVACWFYAEDRFYNSPYTMAVDNSNVSLLSLKFSKFQTNGREETMLSLLNHHVGGFDHSYMGSQGSVRSDATYSNMLRAISIMPLYMSGDDMLAMGDNELGCRLDGSTIPGAGIEVPRCFDIRYRLRNPSTLQSYMFALRVYCRVTPQ